MRYVPPSGESARFIVKALNEAAGELRELFWTLPASVLRRECPPPDDGWSLAALATHLCEVESSAYDRIRSMLAGATEELPPIDFDDLPEAVDHDPLDAVERFAWLRRRTTYLLWDLGRSDWQRTAPFRYRGELSLLDLARELYQHDLEHLWQAKRMAEALLRVPR